LKRTRQVSITREFQRIRKSFVNIAKSFDRLGRALAGAGARAAGGDHAPTRSGRRRPRLSRAQRAALKLQGRYMGTMRGLKASHQARVKSVRKARGVRAAIREARRLARK